MTKEIEFNKKIYGERNITKGILKIPDDVFNIFKEYTIDLVEYPNIQSVSIFLCKDNVDVESITFSSRIKSNYVTAIKTLYERLINEIHPGE
jgi:hypothetical protein